MAVTVWRLDRGWQSEVTPLTCLAHQPRQPEQCGLGVISLSLWVLLLAVRAGRLGRGRERSEGHAPCKRCFCLRWHRAGTCPVSGSQVCGDHAGRECPLFLRCRVDLRI